jgi:hypothetical protein
MKLPKRIAIIGLAVASITASAGGAQTRESSSRTAVIAASFNKSKHAVKERRGVRVEKFKEVKSEPVVPRSPRAFSGLYEVSELGSSLRLQIDDAGRVTGNGTEPLGGETTLLRKFTIRDAHLDGALLTGTKDYGNGSSSKLEGVFINRTSFDSPTDKGTTEFGLGVLTSPIRVYGVTVERLFYQRAPQI